MRHKIVLIVIFTVIFAGALRYIQSDGNQIAKQQKPVKIQKTKVKDPEIVFVSDTALEQTPLIDAAPGEKTAGTTLLRPEEVLYNKGSLIVKSDPTPARLYLDGRYIGSTPVKLNADDGKYELSLVKEGHVRVSRVVRISKGTTTIMKINMDEQRADNTPVGAKLLRFG